jgi:hypothetical protein
MVRFLGINISSFQHFPPCTWLGCTRLGDLVRGGRRSRVLIYAAKLKEYTAAEAQILQLSSRLALFAEQTPLQ